MDLARAPCRAPLTARKKGSGYENGRGPACKNGYILENFCMDNVNSSVNDLEDASSDGEEDFESADEGEGKEKVGNTNDSVVRNSDETGNVYMTGNLSEGMESIHFYETDSDKSARRETSNLVITENILEPSPGPAVDSNIGTSCDKDNISKAHDTEETDTPSASPNVVENEE